MRYKLQLTAMYFLQIILFLFVSEVWCDKILTCPTPVVKKRTIIQSNESLKNGARLIGKDIVNNAKDCYELCCNDATCNVAIMHYKEERNNLNNKITTYKYCFLFACGSPSLCTYEYHRRYAVIDLGPRSSRRDESERNSLAVPQTTTPKLKPSTTYKNRETTTAPPPPLPTTIIPTTLKQATSTSANLVSMKEPVTSTSATNGESKDSCKLACGYEYEPVCGDDEETYSNKCLLKLAKCKRQSLKQAYDGECRECPPGVPMAACSDDPCKIISCPANKHAVCKANFCGGCNAVYYDGGKKVNCSGPGAGPCHAKLSTIPKGLIGAHIPQCKPDGTYKEKQCHGSTGYCWCVEPQTGTEIEGTKKGPTEGEVSCGVCHIKLAAVPKGLIGAHIPQCKPDGTYKEKQCHGSTGYCWCVEPETGNEIEGTKKGPAEEVTCGVGISPGHNEQSVTVSSTDYEEQPEESTLAPGTPTQLGDDPYYTTQRRQWLNESGVGACHRKVSTVPKGLLGSHIPQCYSDGTYKEKQCHASTGYCWCVKPETGTEIEGTKKGPAEEVTCGVSACHIKLATVPKGLVGAHIPQCKPDGTYKEKQCHASTGYCWCVEPQTGTEIEGTKKGPTEGEVTCGSTYGGPPVIVVVKQSALGSFMSLPLLIALIICVVLLIGVVYRVKCVRGSRAKKLPVDDGDYLINGMYL